MVAVEVAWNHPKASPNAPLLHVFPGGVRFAAKVFGLLNVIGVQVAPTGNWFAAPEFTQRSLGAWPIAFTATQSRSAAATRIRRSVVAFLIDALTGTHVCVALMPFIISCSDLHVARVRTGDARERAVGCRDLFMPLAFSDHSGASIGAGTDETLGNSGDAGAVDGRL